MSRHRSCLVQDRDERPDEPFLEQKSQWVRRPADHQHLRHRLVGLVHISVGVGREHHWGASMRRRARHTGERLKRALPSRVTLVAIFTFERFGLSMLYDPSSATCQNYEQEMEQSVRTVRSCLLRYSTREYRASRPWLRHISQTKTAAFLFPFEELPESFLSSGEVGMSDWTKGARGTFRTVVFARHRRSGGHGRERIGQPLSHTNSPECHSYMSHSLPWAASGTRRSSSRSKRCILVVSLIYKQGCRATCRYTHVKTVPSR